MTTTAIARPPLATLQPARTQPTFWQRVWDALERHGQRRAEIEMRRAGVFHLVQQAHSEEQQVAVFK